MGLILQAITNPPLWASITAIVILIIIMLMTWFWPIGFSNPFKKYISLQDAAQKAYDTLGKTTLRNVIKRLNTEDALGYMKQAFFTRDVRFYAKEPPSSILEKLPHDPNRVWKIIGNDLYSPGLNKPEYIDCHIKAKDLRKFIKDYRD